MDLLHNNVTCWLAAINLSNVQYLQRWYVFKHNYMFLSNKQGKYSNSTTTTYLRPPHQNFLSYTAIVYLIKDKEIALCTAFPCVAFAHNKSIVQLKIKFQYFLKIQMQYFKSFRKPRPCSALLLIKACLNPSKGLINTSAIQINSFCHCCFDRWPYTALQSRQAAQQQIVAVLEEVEE